MFNPLRSISNQELFEKQLCNPRIPKERIGTAHPSYINYRLKSEVSIMLRCRLCSSRYTAVYCLKSTSAIKIATMTNTDDFCYAKGSHYAKSTPFTVSKDECGTKEDTGKSMKNALYVLRYARRHLSG